jgi:hypothetical protein
MSSRLVVIKTKDLFKCFQIDLRNFYKNRVYLQHHLHIQPSEINQLSYYEYQWMLKDLVDMIKEQNGEKTNSSMDSQMENMKQNANQYTKNFGKNMPNMSKNFGNFKMPKI